MLHYLWFGFWFGIGVAISLLFVEKISWEISKYLERNRRTKKRKL